MSNYPQLFQTPGSVSSSLQQNQNGINRPLAPAFNRVAGLEPRLGLGGLGVEYLDNDIRQAQSKLRNTRICCF